MNSKSCLNNLRITKMKSPSFKKKSIFIEKLLENLPKTQLPWLSLSETLIINKINFNK